MHLTSYVTAETQSEINIHCAMGTDKPAIQIQILIHVNAIVNWVNVVNYIY